MDILSRCVGLSRPILPSRGIFAISRDSFSCHNWKGVLLAPCTVQDNLNYLELSRIIWLSVSRVPRLTLQWLSYKHHQPLCVSIQALDSQEKI